ncbi:hypothetical protein MMC21_001373 [Puttea exsequens]|nr:hypothetical protein [Puttea exsequens]
MQCNRCRREKLECTGELKTIPSCEACVAAKVVCHDFQDPSQSKTPAGSTVLVETPPSAAKNVDTRIISPPIRYNELPTRPEAACHKPTSDDKRSQSKPAQEAPGDKMAVFEPDSLVARELSRTVSPLARIKAGNSKEVRHERP